jgi:tellurite resistance protein TerC
MFDTHHPLVWSALIFGVLALLAIDIGIVHRRAHRITMREATAWTIVWISIALTFGVIVFFWLGSTPALEYATGYLIELSLSVDNLFVFAVIFTALGVPSIYQHRVLFWGIVGALVMRGAFIFAGTAFLHAFHWSIYVFGAFLIVAAVRIVRETGEANPADARILYWLSRVVPLTPHYHGSAFTIVQNGRRVATALFGALVLIEASDLMFAIDSVPAILAITRDPFLVFSSNAFAVLGLRSMYFVLSNVLERFHYLKFGLGIILGFVGLKLMISEVVHLPVWSSLLVMAVCIGASIAASLLWPAHSTSTAVGTEAD